jgi:hypothetical protein
MKHVLHCTAHTGHKPIKLKHQPTPFFTPLQQQQQQKTLIQENDDDDKHAQQDKCKACLPCSTHE